MKVKVQSLAFSVLLRPNKDKLEKLVLVWILCLKKGYIIIKILYRKDHGLFWKSLCFRILVASSPHWLPTLKALKFQAWSLAFEMNYMTWAKWLEIISSWFEMFQNREKPRWPHTVSLFTYTRKTLTLEPIERAHINIVYKCTKSYKSKKNLTTIKMNWKFCHRQ